MSGFIGLLAVAGGTAAARVPATPTFSRDIAPILFRNCVGCHHPGTNGAFSLIGYEDARPRARLIAEMTRSRYMPPWKPEAGFGGPFLGARELTDAEIATIQSWAATGAPQGDATGTPASPDWNDGWKLGTPDLVIRMPEAYDVPAEGADVFRTFVFPIPIDAARYVKAIEFMPGTRAVHHANMRFDETLASRKLDERDPAPGYDGLTASTAHYPDGYFFGWTPGQLPPASEDLAWRLNPGTDMVLQLHLRPTRQRERAQAAIGLYFTPRPPRLTPVMLRLGKQDIDIPPDRNDYLITDSYRLPVDVDIHAIQPHAHYLAKEIKGFATLPDGTTEWLIYIRRWDFDWQDTYRYAKPFRLPKGTLLTMQYVYDNSTANRRNPNRPPQRVGWGQNSSDEMGDLWIQVVPSSAKDFAILNRDLRTKVFREDVLGREAMLLRTPDDIGLHDDAALLYLAVGDADRAIAHFSAAMRLAPELAVTHYNLGTALAAAQRLDEAMAEFDQALKRQPDYSAALNNLGSVLVAQGRFDAAAVQYRRAVDISPRNAEALNNLGNVLTRLGRTVDALGYLRRALDIRPDYPDAHYNMAHALVAQGHLDEAAPHYQKALALRPDWPEVRAEFEALAGSKKP